MGALDLGIVSLSSVIFFAAGRLFLLKWLFKTIREPGISIQLLYCTLFTNACLIYQFIIFEILDVQDSDFRAVGIKICVILQVFLLVGLCPYYLCHLVLTTYTSRSLKLFYLTPILYALVLYLFWLVGRPFPLLQGDLGIMLHLVGRICVVGITLSAMLSAYGIVHFPYTHLHVLIMPVSYSELQSHEKKYKYVVDLIIKKKLQLSGAKDIDTHHRHRLGLGNIVSSNGGGGLEQAPVLRAEVRKLEEMAAHIYVQLVYLEDQYRRNEHSKSLMGKLTNLIAIIISIFCMIRFVLSLSNILFMRSALIDDPVTSGFNAFEGLTGWGKTYAFFLPQISFLFVTGMMLNSISSFMMNVSRFFRAVSKRSNNDVISLSLVTIMFMYFMSTLINMCGHVLKKHRSIFMSVLGDSVHITFFMRLFDLVFVVFIILFLGFHRIVYRKIK